MRKSTLWWQTAGLVVMGLLFFVSLELMEHSFAFMGRGVAEALLQTTSNPFVGLFVGILATTLVQSSSVVTAMTVGIVAGGGVGVAEAIPIIMGANVETSVTNTIVSLGHITRTEEFRGAVAAATVHDFFNLIAVAVFFPLELTTQFLSRAASALASGLTGVGGVEWLSPVNVVVEPVAEVLITLAQANGVVVLLMGACLLFVALHYLVLLLKKLVLGRSERLIHRYIFGTPALSLLAGILITVMVQSSSITTSITVPLAAAGIVTVTQIFPFVMGANVGTTITALLAALVLASGGGADGVEALEVAFAHLCFNVFGVLLLLPSQRIRRVPVRLAERLGTLAVKNRMYAIAYIALVFFIIPFLVILATRHLDLSF
ncbi:MAG: Na/Pi symporter [Rhodothermales bacterium]